MSLLHLLEPEEFIGGLWHDLVGGGSQIAHFPDAGVRFDEIARRLSIVRGVAASIQSIFARTSGRKRSRATSESSMRQRFAVSYSASESLAQSSYLALSEATTV